MASQERLTCTGRTRTWRIRLTGCIIARAEPPAPGLRGSLSNTRSRSRTSPTPTSKSKAGPRRSRWPKPSTSFTSPRAKSSSPSISARMLPMMTRWRAFCLGQPATFVPPPFDRVKLCTLASMRKRTNRWRSKCGTTRSVVSCDAERRTTLWHDAERRDFQHPVHAASSLAYCSKICSSRDAHR